MFFLEYSYVDPKNEGRLANRYFKSVSKRENIKLFNLMLY